MQTKKKHKRPEKKKQNRENTKSLLEPADTHEHSEHSNITSELRAHTHLTSSKHKLSSRP